MSRLELPLGPEQENHRGQRQPVPGKRPQGHPLDQDDERLDRDQGREERDHEADAEDAHVGGGKKRRAFIEVVERGREHQRHRGNERVFGGEAPLGPEQHAAHDRRGRARKARPQRQALEAADAQRQPRRHFVEGVEAVAFPARFHPEDHERPDGQRQGDRYRAEQVRLDRLARGKPDQPRRQRGEKEQPDAAQPRKGVQSLGRDEPPEALPIKDDHGQDGPELDDDLETVGLLAGEADEVADEDEVAGGGNGQKLRGSLDEAEDGGGDGFGHDGRALRGRFVPAVLSHRRASCKRARPRVCLALEQGGPMTTIMPQGELLRRAVKWIDGQRELTGEPVPALINKAAMNFNMGPKDAEFLVGFFKEREASPRN